MVDLKDGYCTSTLDRKRKRGDTREDGYRFSKFFRKKTKSGEVKTYEKWLSPAAWKKEIDNLSIRSREYRLKNKNNPEYRARKKATDAKARNKEAAKIKQQLNACIREDREIEENDFDCDPNLISFWKLIKSIKEDCLFICRNDGPAAYLGQDRIDAEGYVMTNEFGMFKLVNREVFSYTNFNAGRFQVA